MKFQSKDEKFSISDLDISALEERLSALELLASHTGNSLEGICNAIDTDTYHCCVNNVDNKMYCAQTALASVLGIDVSNGANTCDTSNNAAVCAPD